MYTKSNDVLTVKTKPLLGYPTDSRTWLIFCSSTSFLANKNIFQNVALSIVKRRSDIFPEYFVVTFIFKPI